MTDSTALTTRQDVSAVTTLTEVEHSIAIEKAKLLAKSSVIPKDFQGQPANVLVALEYAHRLNCSALAVMQNLDVIHGRPSLRATFLIGTVNASGRFTPLRPRFQGKEGTDEWGCRAVAIDKASGEECVGPLITIQLAKDEGWYNKSGSKWKTIPELMLSYRAAAWWTRIFAPDLALGLHTTDELEDSYHVSPQGRAREVMSALRAPDPEPVTQDAEIVEDDEPMDDRTKAAQGRYFALLAERGMADDVDRRTYQKRLADAGLVSGPSCKGWTKQDFLSAAAEVEKIPVEEGASA